MITRLPADLEAMAQQLAHRLLPADHPPALSIPGASLLDPISPLPRPQAVPRDAEPILERGDDHAMSAARRTGVRPRVWRMSPELSYGRHAGPARWDTRRAAVQVLLVLDQGTWHLPLTLRPHHLPRHAGQICFAGGIMEEHEEGRQCAWREWCEELGEPGGTWRWVGQLPSTYVFASNFLVTPYVALTDRRPQYRLNREEVAEVVELPLENVLHGDWVGEHIERRGPLRFRAPHFRHADYRVWGATALILEMLSRQFQPLPGHDFSR
jgi:8-oxo-dGTP pyrophosphatase MutT (NUDIX family)